jgi:aryl-alcohol dehydrogenase-like predicted oxidoreductase
VTNTDVHHLNELLGAGVEVVSNQIQFSLIDPRPLNGMLKFAKENDIKLFCYGVLAGGLLGNSKPGNEPMNRSHIKYGLMVDEAGEDYYESTLKILEELANKYDTTRANIAAAFILSYPEVSSVILGPRNAAHVAELDALTNLKLEDADSQLLRNRLAQFGTKVDGDIYSYERDMNSRHGSIMKYNLNGMRT